MERETLAKVLVCLCTQQYVYRRKVSIGSYMSIGKLSEEKPYQQPHLPGSQEPCHDCRNKMCSNTEQERIQQALLSRLFLAGCDSKTGPLESYSVCLYLGRICQNQGQLLSKISKLPVAGRILMLLILSKDRGSANSTTPNTSRDTDRYK